jgi:hypothetical protein
MFKDFKTTKDIYGVTPEYFENMNYFDAIKEKIRLVDERIKEINKKIDYRLPNEKYRKLCYQLMKLEKAKKFNQMLLMEYKITKRKKNDF